MESGAKAAQRNRCRDVGEACGRSDADGCSPPEAGIGVHEILSPYNVDLCGQCVAEQYASDKGTDVPENFHAVCISGCPINCCFWC